MTPNRLFKKAYAKELLQVATEDLESAVILKDGHVSRKENALFHVQQSIEKALKACICHLEQPVPLVHDLITLIKVIPDYENIPHHDGIYDLTQFATIRRYEEGVAIITEEELTESIDAATKILQWANDFITKS